MFLEPLFNLLEIKKISSIAVLSNQVEIVFSFLKVVQGYNILALYLRQHVDFVFQVVVNSRFEFLPVYALASKEFSQVPF
jgi:uncharacterized protein YozE (UPF0346 family)